MRGEYLHMSELNKHPLFYAYCAVAWLGCGLLLCLFRNGGSFAETWATHVYPLFPATLGRLTALLPFSLSELLLIIAAVALLALIPLLAARLIRRKSVLPPLRILLATISTLALLFMLTVGGNYFRTDFATLNSWVMLDDDQEGLEQLCHELIDQAELTIPGLDVDVDGLTKLPPEMPLLCVEAMSQLGQSYPTLDIHYSMPNPALLSRLMTAANITGIFSPFTIEAHYNKLIPPYTLPYTICHELAHSAGYMREDEAGFLAYLACSQAEDATLRYSGAVLGLTYALNAYAGAASAEEYAALYAELPEQVVRDMRSSRDFWANYQGHTAEIAKKTNDAYLRANGAAAGVASYSQMVQLMLAYHRTASNAETIILPEE